MVHLLLFPRFSHIFFLSFLVFTSLEWHAIKARTENKCSVLSCFCKASPLVEEVGRVIRAERLLNFSAIDGYWSVCYDACIKYSRARERSAFVHFFFLTSSTTSKSHAERMTQTKTSLAALVCEAKQRHSRNLWSA